jgi:hypothetical protein
MRGRRTALAGLLVLVLCSSALLTTGAKTAKTTGIANCRGSFYYEPWGGESSIRFKLREYDDGACTGPVAVLIDGEWWEGSMECAEGNFIDENSSVVLATVFCPDGSDCLEIGLCCYDLGPRRADTVVISEASGETTYVKLETGHVTVRDFTRH